MSFRSRRTVSRSKNSSDRKLRIEPLEERSLLAADFDLIGEFLANPVDRSSNPGPLGDLNGLLLFATSSQGSPSVLWTTDGTASGTTQLFDFGTTDFSRRLYGYAQVDGTLYFLVQGASLEADGVGFNLTEWGELWRSNGTTEGTEKVQTMPMHNPFSYFRMSSLSSVGNRLYFTVQDLLWTSDGTAVGTVPLHAGVQLLATLDDKLIIAESDGFSPRRLFSYDSATIQPSLLTDKGSSVQNLTRVGDSIFYTAHTFESGRELWKTDGTPAGTSQVKDINPDTSNSNPVALTNVAGTLYFSANDGSSGSELWKSDGTEAGTVRVKDINLGEAGLQLSAISGVNSVAYFIAKDGITGSKLWKSDGSEQGTVSVAEIGIGDSNYGLVSMTNVDGILYFSANEGADNRELWRSDGTGAGTYMVRDILPGSKGSYPSAMMNVGGRLFFSAYGRIADRELWVSDGTHDGTHLVKDLFDFDLTWPRRELFEFDGELFFSARFNPSSMFDDELWKSDGTVGGTALLKEFNPGWFGATPTEFTVLGGSLYFKVFFWRLFRSWLEKLSTVANGRNCGWVSRSPDWTADVDRTDAN